MSAYEVELARLREKGGSWTEEQLEMMARRNVAFARGPRTPVECVGIELADGKYLAVLQCPRTGERIAQGDPDWPTRRLAAEQAREIAFARGYDPVQS